MKLNPSPIVILNRLIVIYKLKSSKIALKELEDSSMKKDWERNYLYHSLLGEIYTSIDKQKAKESFKKAIELTQSIHEKKLLQRKIEKL